MLNDVILATTDNTLRPELQRLLPGGFLLSPRREPKRKDIVFFDIDTISPGLIRDLSGMNTVIAITGRKDTAPVMEATTFGAYETLQRPLTKEVVSILLEQVLQFRKELGKTTDITGIAPVPTCAIVGHSDSIMSVCKKVARLAQVEVPVLITGETGTGKELIAESIAQLSARFGRPFVVVNCAAVPETLLESELFGFEKGAFTGAVSAKEGMLHIADGGCVFLDEVGELPLSLQAKLLRFLQTQSFYPIGSTREITVDVRVISATNRDLPVMIREGRFREDLYHRLRVSSLHIPPLRERKEDILPLISFFLNRYRHTAPSPLRGITSAFLKRLLAYDWPGNIRELENTIRSAIALSKAPYLTTFELKELGEHSRQPHRISPSEALSSFLIPLVKESIGRREDDLYARVHHTVDRLLFDHVLSMTGENQSEAARVLGINRLTLRKKLLSP